MKKNININLFGTLYAIDEDACTLLENYLDNMRSYFAKRDGGDEIYDDIEHRVAEHLWSLKQSGQTAIDINNVKQIISSIGNPDEMESGVEEADEYQAEGTPGAEAGDATNRQNEGNEDNSQDEANDDNRLNEASGSNRKYEDANNHGEGKWTDRVLHHVSTHRFYRDGKDKIGGGVISGLCHYCGGGDIVVWRVATVLFIMAAFALNQTFHYYFFRPLFGLLFSVPIIVYIALWLVAPVARTTEERLCMTGKEVTPESISKAIIAEAKSRLSPPQSAPRAAAYCREWQRY